MTEKTYRVTVKKWQLPRPSVYTPFFRRWFGDERSRELDETIALYASVRAQHEDWLKEHENARRIDMLVILDCAKIERGHALYAPFEKAVSSLLSAESVLYDFPYTNWDVAVLSLKELVELRDHLRQKEHFFANEKRIHTMLYFALDNLFTGLAAEAPKIGASALFVTPLILTYREPKLVADKVHGTLIEDEYWDNGLFRKYHEQMRYNICDIEKIAPDAEIKRPLTAIADSPLSPIEIVERYFRKTPFRELLLTPVPLDVSDEAFFSHMHVVGGSGAGKTQWLQSLIHYHLTQSNPPALVIVDSQGDLINNVSRLDLFHPEHGALKDKILIITPREIRFPPAINIFDINRERLGKYEEAILSQPKLHFACYIRNVTGQAISLPVAAGLLESQPRMSESDYEDLRFKNQPKVSTVLDDAEEPQPDSESEAAPMEKASHDGTSRANVAKPASEQRRQSPSTSEPDAPLENW